MDDANKGGRKLAMRGMLTVGSERGRHVIGGVRGIPQLHDINPSHAMESNNDDVWKSVYA